MLRRRDRVTRPPLAPKEMVAVRWACRASTSYSGQGLLTISSPIWFPTSLLLFICTFSTSSVDVYIRVHYCNTKPLCLLKANKLTLMVFGYSGSSRVKSFSRQTGQQELVVWRTRDARLSLNFLALPKYRDEGRASINHWRLEALFLPAPQGCTA